VFHSPKTVGDDLCWISNSPECLSQMITYPHILSALILKHLIMPDFTNGDGGVMRNEGSDLCAGCLCLDLVGLFVKS